MRRIHLFTILLVPLIAAGVAFAQQDDSNSPKGRSATGKTVTMTGCLTKGQNGDYMLTDEKSGKQVTVTGSADLEKDAMNHKVRVTGTESSTGGMTTLSATSVRHVSHSCTSGGK